MMCNLWLSTVSLLGLTAVVKSACDPKPTGCQTNITENENDIKVSDPAALNCSFENRLCCYTQGCVDIGMGNWTAENGTATVKQISSPTCAVNVYSVLESPWVNVSIPWCVEFTYSRGQPNQLEVFLAFSNGTQPSLIENSTIVGEQHNQTKHFTIAYLTGKIQFRVRGGGGINTSPLKLYYVRITEGDCHNPASSVRSEVSDSSTCNLATTPPTTQHAASKSTTHPTASSTDASSSPRSSVTQGMSSGRPSETSDDDGGSVSNVGVITGAMVAAVAAVVVVIIVIVYRRKSHTRKPDGGSCVGGMSTSAKDLSDPARASDASSEYLTPMNVYEGLANRNIEENLYNALANQNSTYEGLSPNRNENRLYDSLVASGGQSEDYKIPDTTDLNKERVTEV